MTIERYIAIPKKEIVDKGTPVGSPYYHTAKLSIIEGVKVAERGDKHDLQKQINAFKDSTDIVSLCTRLQNGDTTVLNIRPAMSGDLTMLPKNVNDIINGVGFSEKALDNFNKLPDEVKKLFGSPSAFYDAVLTNKVDEILASLKEPKTPESDPEPKVDDTKKGDPE